MNYPYNFSTAASELAAWQSAASGANTTLGDGRPVSVGAAIKRNPKGPGYAVVIHVSVSFAERRKTHAGPHHNAYAFAPASSSTADLAAFVVNVRSRIIQEATS